MMYFPKSGSMCRILLLRFNGMIRKQIKNFNLYQISDSGQCFRMTMADEAHARVVAFGRVLDITDNSGSFEFSCTEEEYREIWSDYFDLNEDYEGFIASIDPKDVFLTKAAGYGSGIRILRQEPFETLVSFIISQRKNIPAIQSSVEKLCRLCGDKIEDDIYAFPKAEAIEALSESELSGCSLGYRAPYVREAARRVACHETDLVSLHGLNDDELKESLMSFYGVGEKVANCVMLFAYHRIGAFPVDVWIKRIEDEYYNGSFPIEKYQGFAGVLQQYMFFYGRKAGV